MKSVTFLAGLPALLCVLFCSHVAASESVIARLIAAADENRLSDEKKWHGLVLYYTPSVGELRSYVDDKNFFLAKKGKTDPKAELEATIRGFFQDYRLGDEHPICLFPARFEWIQAQLKIDSHVFPKPECKEYLAWREQVNATRLSLIFPSAYINSPSSMFGHTLFRFDPEDVDQGTDWLSWSLSFGAFIDNSDSSIEFAYRGIFGGYPGVYSMMHYFKKIKEYNHLENRDIWEYELDIDAEGVRDMLVHTWELKDTRFDYYFLDENCAFRLLEQIELVRDDVQLTSQFGFTAIPANTVRAIVDEGLVKSVSFKPSATTVLKSRVEELSEDEQVIARRLSDDITVLQGQDYQALSKDRKAKVVQVAYSFLRYRQLKILRDEKLAERSHQLLLELNTLPFEEHKVSRPVRPEQGHKTQMAGMSAGVIEGQAYAQLNYRVTYHDLLDNPDGYPQGAHIAMGNTQLRLLEGDEVDLQRFDFIDIVSLSEIDSFFMSPSWHVITGYEDVFARNTDGVGKNTGAYYVKAGVGAAWRATPSVITYGFADARVEHNAMYKPFINTAFGLSGGLLAYNSWGTLNISAESDYFTNDEYRVVTSLEQNIPLSVNDAVRVSLSQEWHRDFDQYDVSIAYRHYF